VTIFASNTEIAASIGLLPRIVGIEAFTRYPPDVLDRPLVGGRLGFSAEAIVKLGADLVVMTPSRQAANQLVRPLERVGIPALVLQTESVQAVFDNIALVGRAAGVDDEARRVIARLEARIGAVAARVADRPPVRAYLETGSTGRGGFQTVRAGTYTADMLRLAGGATVFPDPAIAQVSGEALITAAPDVILIAGTEAQAAAVPARVGWSSLPAVQSQKVFAVPRPILLIPGPRIADGVERLAKLLHPEAFRE
jgi:iron complex transport system substrate-binding protein